MSLLPRPTSSSIVELILELFCETAKRILCYFTPSESRALYEASLALVRTYAAHQVKRERGTKENSQVMSPGWTEGGGQGGGRGAIQRSHSPHGAAHQLAQQGFHWSQSRRFRGNCWGGNCHQSRQYHGWSQCSTHHHKVVTAADVCLLGLNIIMPLMSAELLKFPNLCLQVEYFRWLVESRI